MRKNPPLDTDKDGYLNFKLPQSFLSSNRTRNLTL